MRFKLNLQYFASKKGVGSTKNGRDSHSKRLGAKAADGQLIRTGQIIYRQRGTKIHPGINVGRGSDDTLFALKNGILKFVSFAKNKTKAGPSNEKLLKAFGLDPIAKNASKTDYTPVNKDKDVMP